ncbi:MAG: NAD(P)H-binding protein [Hamadaea sp.]|uniref:NAD(P)H-binding protein n=1 Tax=Hamadaea sp. TaxID=2024425 RepID=UPI0018183525|nr:NAD(P)H-binding protein [Hamadaea sp.]NUT22963.1 NAD(P)H-binding protein [Hamadaea sp.]
MRILIAGSTGTVGRQIVAQLVEQGHSVRALTRNPEAALPGAEMVVGDLTDPGSLADALDGVEAMHLISFDGGGYQPLTTGPELVELASRAGVKRVTLLGNKDESGVEKALRDSNLAWTLVQPVEFMGNALAWIPAVQQGAIREPFLDRRSAMVHEADIAAVAVVALTEDGHGGRTYTVTGPEVLTVPEKVAALSAALGREIGLVELTEAEAREKWAGEGLAADIIDFLIFVYGNTPEIGYTVVSTVEDLTGRPARTFAQWCTENAPAFG